MAIASPTIILDNGSDANYRAWGTIISAQFAAMGLVQTADTGQVDWTTATRSAVSGANYEIWKFNDTLQAGHPIYLKVEYVNTSGAGNYGFAFSVGFATDGAGNLTGQNSGRIAIDSTFLDSSATTHQCYVSGDVNRFCMGLIVDTGHPLYFSIERTKDASGADTVDGAIIIFANRFTQISGAGLTDSHLVFLYVPTSGGVPNGEKSMLAILSSNSASLYSLTIAAGAVIPLAGGPQNPGINQLLGLVADFPDGFQYSIPVYGVNHNYINLGTNMQAMDVAIRSDSRVLMLYE